jgi:gliding motility-associated-like protein
MIRFGLIAFLFTGCILDASAQSVTIDRQVIGSAGANYAQGTHSVTSTTGESAIITSSSQNQILTQGFQQPSPKALISFVVVTSNESCLGARNGMATIQDISGCSPPYQIQWSNGTSGITASALSTGSYSVVVSSATCQSEQTFFIGLDQDVDCQLIIYTGITPNGDNNNDYWHIEGIELERYQSNKVTIFNRWGDVVWLGENYDNQNVRWVGEGKKERELPDGTYFYVIEFNDNTLKGYVELTR